MNIGFILTKTPFEEGFSTFIKFINIYMGKEDINVYLLGNGIYAAKKEHKHAHSMHNILKKCSVYSYLPDMDARGISSNHLIEGIQLVESYDDIIVDLMEKMDQILSF
ncbi:MAG: sulfurtransferase complex subunit TusB [Methanomicrobiales archaeon]